MMSDSQPRETGSFTARFYNGSYHYRLVYFIIYPDNPGISEVCYGVNQK